ncbi:recombinase family protein [Streptomyces sp. YGL11-2]|uniref:recombinase family protein n=1 Tax=Streptomyces sp. YGL11-2 TaxID=3414028 RepID=UPI003CE69C92
MREGLHPQGVRQPRPRARARQGPHGRRRSDQLVVTKFDHLSSSLENLIELSTRVKSEGVGLVVLDQGVDASTTISRMLFRILGAVAEFEPRCPSAPWTAWKPPTPGATPAINKASAASNRSGLVLSASADAKRTSASSTSPPTSRRRWARSSAQRAPTPSHTARTRFWATACCWGA